MTSSPARVKPPAGPPCSVTDPNRRRRQTPVRDTSLAPYTMCRQASKNGQGQFITSAQSNLARGSITVLSPPHGSK